MEKNKIINKSHRVKKWDFFFAFYRFSYFYKLWFVVYVLSIFVSFLFELPFILRYIGTIVVSATISLAINGTIIFFIDISDGTPIGNSDNYEKGPSAQTMRMLKRNIRRRWFWLATTSHHRCRMAVSPPKWVSLCRSFAMPLGKRTGMLASMLGRSKAWMPSG